MTPVRKSRRPWLIGALLALSMALAATATVTARAQTETNSVASGFAKFRQNQGQQATTPIGVQSGFSALTFERQLQQRLQVERGRYLSASDGICRSQMQALDACYARSTCGAPAPPAGYSESQCRAIPGRPYYFPPLLTSGSCDAACQEETSQRQSAARQAISGQQAIWDAQWSSLAAICRTAADQRKPFEACLQAHRKSCNPQDLTHDRCVADRATRAPTLEAVRAMVAREAPTPEVAARQLAAADAAAKAKTAAQARQKAADDAKAKSAADYKALMARMDAEHAAQIARINAPEKPKAGAPGQGKLEIEKAARDKAAKTYLDALTQGTRLSARKCPGGEGKYYVVGLMPTLKPQVVPCVDVHYRAQCVSANSFTDGVASNFVGVATDCFMGDTARIEPTPACPIEQVKVVVREVTACVIGKPKGAK